jgi:uncharacterized cupredoxin-like copper-binding protein
MVDRRSTPVITALGRRRRSPAARAQTRPLFVAAALLVSVPVVPPSLAADEPTTVKVALLDMSSAMGMGMMGRGMMGGPMMQNWWGQGQNQGGWMGPGMMGGRMGMMSVRTDHSTVKAGPVHFDVTNWSKGMLHELLVVAVDEPAAPLPYDYAQAKVAEDQVRVLGDTSELQPNASGGLDLTLSAGSYLLICNIAGHSASGMAVPLTVTSP